MKPDDVFDREREWSALEAFARGLDRRGAVGLVYGRRRHGKSYLLRRLADAFGGIYFQATENERTDALAEFGRAVGTHTAGFGRDGEPIQYANWDDALGRRSGLVVIDEFPYLLKHSPELPSLLQRLVDESVHGAREPLRVILCGSSLSVMSKLLAGQQPLRGRATLDLFLTPFDHVQTAGLWEVDDLDVAARLFAILGGAPGYRALTVGAPPDTDHLGEWLATNVLHPAHALYREGDYLLREDPTIVDRALYGSILTAVANGIATQTELAGRLARSRESLSHPLSTLLDAGFLVRDDDLFHPRRPLYTLADPIVRFLRLVVDPARPLLDEYHWQPVWERAVHRLDAQVFGPALESIARRWALMLHRPSGGELVTQVGRTVVADPVARKPMEIDLVALGPEEGSARRRVLLLGEVTWTSHPPDAVARLKRARSLLGALGHDVRDCELALVSRAAPPVPSGVLGVGLDELYGRGERTA